jgi:thiosulfate/3-mercaptopyruvate sulfurtransferase
MSAGPLISAGELASLLARPSSQSRPTVLDVRSRTGGPPGRDEYALGHVPGAVYVDLDTDLAAPPGGGRGRHPLPDVPVFEAAMRAAGVSTGRPVVVYDDWEGRAAARAWWLLRFHGPEEVRVLDGGWAAWLAEGGEGVAASPMLAAGDFTARPGAMPVVDAGSVLEAEVVVDARAPERYRGEVEPIDPVAGHLPGAVNVPTTENVDEDGYFLPAGELAATYEAVGADPAVDVAAYCGSGVTAAHDVLALEIAGVRAALYPGSWSEWVSDPSRPVETG